MFTKRLLVGLYLAAPCCMGMIPPTPLITESDLTRPSLFAREVGKLNDERTRAPLSTVLSWSFYALWAHNQPAYAVIPSVNVTGVTQQASGWWGKLCNHLKFTTNLTIDSLVSSTIERLFTIPLVPRLGILYRFPTWDDYMQTRWFTHHLNTITRNLDIQNAAALRRATALFAETSKQIITDVRYIISQLLENQKELADTLRASADLLFTLTNKLIDTVNKQEINWEVAQTQAQGLKDCMKSITLLAHQANTLLKLIE